MCRAYGVLPSDLPPRGTAERAFLESEWVEYVDEMNENTNDTPGSISGI